ncbi:hypothetical protein PAAG_03176 [Paracoccidioides lutzii Pb01]|uniref:Microbial-type PARG catalytic domain-containing protein n=1 Tax=Paracoccidioides lutzii (strain ATCC MYA-826 / Pb01) TaxID=502779 RepID=C1GYM2_PARBA|nr:hypothetical protein PAAG_12627 [Paracoccidioides lutzii Pb01]XP_002794631.2 hypothetical protein PAAG_03176 [Paracoccidioides lutzii Pb01]EEH41613.2 hypothetical protein PAAG_03176 [Paracoccidioides lutzii Pb01]KGQ00712.1 hypothetical protein PAAG_12627 [Paracoccidioides lutzii Pb01]
MSNPTKTADNPVNSPHSRDAGNGNRKRRGRGQGRGCGRREHDSERERLRAVSYETKALIPNILAASKKSYLTEGFLYRSPAAPPLLDQRFCPGYTGTKIQVLNVDTFDAGIRELSSNSNPSSTTVTEPTPPAPVAVLNMASDFALGGGWLGGARAQEGSPLQTQHTHCITQAVFLSHAR